MATNRKRRTPAVSESSQEQRCINMAYTRAEEMLIDGTAPPSMINFFLKLGSSYQKLDNDVKEAQATLARSKADAIVQEENNRELTEQALEALRSYQQ